MVVKRDGNLSIGTESAFFKKPDFKVKAIELNNCIFCNKKNIKFSLINYNANFTNTRNSARMLKNCVQLKYTT